MRRRRPPEVFYKWCEKPYSDRDFDDAHVVNKIVDIHADDPEFGYRFITDELHNAGVAVSEGRVQRLCHEHQIFSVISKNGKKRPPAGPAAHEDLVQRDFTADGPNQLWLTDLTEHPTGEGKLYVAAVKDVWSNRIVGYSMAGRMTASLAERALTNAITIRDVDAGCIVHSDHRLSPANSAAGASPR